MNDPTEYHHGDATPDFTARPDDAELDELEAERRRRLDPANRPANAQVDNTHRHFNPKTGHFDDYDESLQGKPTTS